MSSVNNMDFLQEKEVETTKQNNKGGKNPSLCPLSC
jgi:hypothetical protein